MIYIVDKPQGLRVLINGDIFYVDNLNKQFHCKYKGIVNSFNNHNVEDLPVVAFEITGRVFYLHQEFYEGEIITSIIRNQNQLIIKTKADEKKNIN